jgi:hypothetical protein
MSTTATVVPTKRHAKIAKRVRASNPKPPAEMDEAALLELLGLGAATADLDEDTDDSDDDDALSGEDRGAALGGDRDAL